MREGGLSEVLNSIELEKSSFGAISFRLYCFVSISNKLKRIGTDCGSCFEVFLAALTLSLELSSGQREKKWNHFTAPKFCLKVRILFFRGKKKKQVFGDDIFVNLFFVPRLLRMAIMLRDDVMSGPRFHWTLRKLTAFVGAIEQTAPLNSLSFVAHVGLEKRIYLSSLRLFLV